MTSFIRRLPQSPSPEASNLLCDMTEAERAVVAGAVEQAWADMMAGARSLCAG